jgi:ABC-type glycerol-3-phosphate transport system substrate-binding protein
VAQAGIDPDPLERELVWLQDLRKVEVLSPLSLQIDSLESTLSLMQKYDESAVTTYSAVAHTRGLQAAFPPTPDGSQFTLATVWSWAIATPDISRQRKAAELLQWLSEPSFLGEWTRLQGWIPTTSAAFTAWPQSQIRELLIGLSEHALPYPSEEISAAMGPVFSQATRKVLIDGNLPADAAREAARSLTP